MLSNPYDCVFTEEGLKHLAKLPDLQKISLIGANVSAGFAVFSECNNLRELDLRVTRITDNSLIELAKLTHLKVLKIRSTKVTDEGLLYLKSMTELEQLYVGPGITSEPAQLLGAVLPNCISIISVDSHGNETTLYSRFDRQ
jgi:Leucine Rich repeat